LLRQLNDEPLIRRLGVTRRALFEELDRPNLKSLPAQPYCFAEWRIRRVGVDYHVELQGHFYSVPYRFARSEVEVRLTPRTVEIFLKGERIAAHLRASGNHRQTTVSEHMPSSHRRYADWTIERIRCEATKIGPATAALCELILERRPHPEQGFRACLGIVRLVRSFGVDPQEAAATRAIEIGTLTSARCAPSSTTSSIARRRTGRPPMACRSSTPISADRATTTEENAMLTHPMLDQLGQIGLSGMAQAFAELESSTKPSAHPCRLARPVARSRAHPPPRQAAGCSAALCHTTPGGQRRGRRLTSPERPRRRSVSEAHQWRVDRHDNLILCGPTGVGKSWLACALGHKACAITALFSISGFTSSSPSSLARYARILRGLTGVQLLTLDRLVHNAHRVDLAGDSLRRRRSRSISED